MTILFAFCTNEPTPINFLSKGCNPPMGFSPADGNFICIQDELYFPGQFEAKISQFFFLLFCP